MLLCYFTQSFLAAQTGEARGRRCRSGLVCGTNRESCSIHLLSTAFSLLEDRVRAAVLALRSKSQKGLLNGLLLMLPSYFQFLPKQNCRELSLRRTETHRKISFDLGAHPLPAGYVRGSLDDAPFPFYIHDSPFDVCFDKSETGEL